MVQPPAWIQHPREASQNHSSTSQRHMCLCESQWQKLSGVRCPHWQGCVMAPVLFNIFFDVVTKLSLQNHQQKGLPLLYHLGEQTLVGGRKKFTNELLLNNMAYADDMVLLADSKSNLEEMLRSFYSTCSTMGLTISTAKTKVLAFLPSGQTEPANPTYTPSWTR